MREPNKTHLSWKEGEREEAGREAGREGEREGGRKGGREEGREGGREGGRGRDRGRGTRKEGMEGGREGAWTEKEGSTKREGRRAIDCKCKKAHKKQLGRVVVLCTQMADHDCSKQEKWTCTLTS